MAAIIPEPPKLSRYSQVYKSYDWQEKHAPFRTLQNDDGYDEPSPKAPTSEKKKPKKGQKKTKKKSSVVQLPSAPKLPGVCSEFTCKSKLAVQAEIIEKVIKDKDRVESEIEKLKASYKADLA